MEPEQRGGQEMLNEESLMETIQVSEKFKSLRTVLSYKRKGVWIVTILACIGLMSLSNSIGVSGLSALILSVLISSVLFTLLMSGINKEELFLSLEESNRRNTLILWGILNQNKDSNIE